MSCAELRAVLHQPPDVAIATVVAAIGLDVELAVAGPTPSTISTH